jgi:hypothetical protein
VENAKAAGRGAQRLGFMYLCYTENVYVKQFDFCFTNKDGTTILAVGEKTVWHRQPK